MNLGLVLPHRGVLPVIPDSSYIAPTGVVIGDVVLGERTSVWFGAVVRGDVHFIRVGDETNIQDGAIVHVTKDRFSTRIGRRITIGHGAIVHGCVIEDLCLIGMGARVLDGAVIPCGSIVAAGAVVLEGGRFPERSLIAGVPARARRTLTGEEVARLEESADHYVEYSQIYVEEETARRRNAGGPP
jgi:carbonic anhydrase/acetyltransferase-like protein (isoleucine patch superfamily)